MRQINLISFTPLDAGGGVPRWNRDFIAGFPGTRHFSWTHFPVRIQDLHGLNEWEKAIALNRWLLATNRVSRDDIFICDGFWANGLETCKNVVSVAHGIWGHLTKEDVDAGKQPDFPDNHAAQIEFRRKHLFDKKPIVAVSDFISRQMSLQWGYESTVINNAIDLDKFGPCPINGPPYKAGQRRGRLNWKLDKRLIVHGVTNANKGFEHITALKAALPNDDVLLLDDAVKAYGLCKEDVLCNADLIVQPSAYEGNSYFVLETLASDTPIVAYNVGLLNSISEICDKNGVECSIGCVIDRKLRSPETTVKVSKWILESVCRDRSPYNPRQVAGLFSIQSFHEQWREFLKRFP